MSNAASLALEPAAYTIESLLQSIRPVIVATVRRMLGGNGADVDDAVQETMIGFVDALPAFRGEAPPASYARTIAFRTALAARKKSRRTQSRQGGAYDEASTPSHRGSPEDEAVAERRRTLLRQLLSEIPAAQAEALAMRLVLGLSLEEIAARTGTPVNTVRSRMRLAKEALRKKIEASPDLTAEVSFR